MRTDNGQQTTDPGKRQPVPHARPVRRYLLNVAIAFDQFLNALRGGDPDETLSSRYGRIKRKHGGRIPLYRPFVKIIDWGLERIDRGHSIDSIEEDEGHDGIIDRPLSGAVRADRRQEGIHLAPRPSRPVATPSQQRSNTTENTQPTSKSADFRPDRLKGGKS